VGDAYHNVLDIEYIGFYRCGMLGSEAIDPRVERLPPEIATEGNHNSHPLA
jgi:hypothetical protein